MKRLALAAVDGACVLAFAAAGRRSHAETATLAGIAETAWPFLVGAAAGWVAARAWRRPAALSTGLVVWPCAALGGMLLRVLATDRGTAPGFIAVAVIALGVAMLGWRAVAAVAQRRRDGSPEPA